jgi:uncharacterized protein (TIGR02421 family)
MSRTRVSERSPKESGLALIEEVLSSLDAGKRIRKEFEDGGRLHIDRPLPFLCVHLTDARNDLAAREVASANASYLITSDLHAAVLVVEAIGAAMVERFGAFLVLDIGELERDRFLSEDAPYLPPFEIVLSATDQTGACAALAAFGVAMEIEEAKSRSPRLERRRSADDPNARLATLSGYPCLTLRFAPVYRVPESEDIYPDLLQRMVAKIFDAGLQAIAAFLKATGAMRLPTHRALGRQAFIDVVRRADRSIDDVSASFDFLLAVTPINADAAWREFEASRFECPPELLYRPLTLRADVEKRKLFSIDFDHFEDPVLFQLYSEKQQELDLQLSMLSARNTPRFVEISRALYGPVEPALLGAARDILVRTETAGSGRAGHDVLANVDCYFLESAARSMIAAYRRQYEGFEPRVELRDDLPSGLMVVNDRLLISRSTSMARHRIEALLSHEIGIHLLTYFNGSAQGLHLFRLGLAGYEGMQEGLAVFAEYLVGGMTVARLRLIAGRVVGCAAMLEGASFEETFRLLVRNHGFSEAVAFNLTLRLYRGGGLTKDAIYLRGLLEVLDHLGNGRSLDPFWMGKIAASHFDVVQELNMRGLLKAPEVEPAFLSHPQSAQRLEKAKLGLTPVELLARSG